MWPRDRGKGGAMRRQEDVYLVTALGCVAHLHAQDQSKMAHELGDRRGDGPRERPSGRGWCGRIMGEGVSTGAGEASEGVLGVSRTNCTEVPVPLCCVSCIRCAPSIHPSRP